MKIQMCKVAPALGAEQKTLQSSNGILSKRTSHNYLQDNKKKKIALKRFCWTWKCSWTTRTAHTFWRASACIYLYSGPWRDLVCVPYLAPAIFGPWSVLWENLHALWQTRLPKEQMPPGSVMSSIFKAILVLLRTAICCKYCKYCLQVPQELKWPPGMKTQDWGTSLLQHT